MKTIFTTALLAMSSLLNATPPATPPAGLSPFPTGEFNAAYAQYFIGNSYLARLTQNTELQQGIINVTFEPACRNNWHSHTAGQILICVGGEGWYQEQGQAPRRLKAGDVVEIPPNIIHWHGATATSWFSHLAMDGKATPENKTTWLAPVDDAHYKALPSSN